jgi:hypothetical protein
MTQMFAIHTNSMLPPCRVVSTSNQTGTYNNGPLNSFLGATFTYTSTGALTIDSVVLSVGNRVLLQNQTSGFQNGIYVVTVAGDSITQAVLQRAPDFQSIEQMKAGSFVPIGAGTVNAGFHFTLVEPIPLILGTNNITFIQA